MLTAKEATISQTQVSYAMQDPVFCSFKAASSKWRPLCTGKGIPSMDSSYHSRQRASTKPLRMPPVFTLASYVCMEMRVQKPAGAPESRGRWPARRVGVHAGALRRLPHRMASAVQVAEGLSWAPDQARGPESGEPCFIDPPKFLVLMAERVERAAAQWQSTY